MKKRNFFLSVIVGVVLGLFVLTAVDTAQAQKGRQGGLCADGSGYSMWEAELRARNAADELCRRQGGYPSETYTYASGGWPFAYWAVGCTNCRW